MGGTVEFVQPLPTPIGGQPQEVAPSLVPPVPPVPVVNSAPPVVDFQEPAQQQPQRPAATVTPLNERVAANVSRAPTPLEVMQYGMVRLLEEAEAEADTMHRGVLKNGALAKFMGAQDLANKAAKYMHSTKVDAEIKTDGTGHSYEDELAAILAIANGQDT